MSAPGSPTRSRTTTLVLVAGAHALVLWAIWDVHPPSERPGADFSTVLFFIPVATRPHSVLRQPALAAFAAPSTPAAVALAAEDSPWPANSAITPPSLGHARIDWSGQIATAADHEMQREAAGQRQLTALMRRFVLEADPLNAHDRAPTQLHWAEAGRSNNRDWLGTLHLDEHCRLEGLKIPDCAIERIAPPTSLLDFMVKKHQATMVTPGPNTVP